MVKKKILIISDYVKKHYIGTKQGQSYNKFMETNEGRFLKSLMLEAFEKVGYEESCSYKAIFAIPEIPNLIKENKKNPELSLYTTPSLQKVKEYKENLLERIYEYNPDVVIVTGSISIKSIFGSGSIKAMRTLPGEIEIKDKKFPYFVTYSPGFVRSNPNYLSLSKIDMQHLGKFLKDGSDGLKKSKVDYTILKNDSADKVVRLLGYIKDNFGKTPRDAVAWDYETNSLSGTSDTSKVITASISTSDHKGITFPIDHPEYPWNQEDRKKVVNAWLDFLISPIWKVGHNVSFDMRQTKTIIKPIQFKNTLDTLVAYYIGVSQENKGGKSLKDLALLFTDMGNYDKQLDEFKSWFNSGFDKGKSKELKDKYEGTTYVQRVKAYLQEGTEIEDKYYLEYLTDSQKIVAFKTAKRLLEEQGFPDTVYNEQEPSTDFSYAWIPYEVLAYYACGDVDATKRINYYMWDTYISKVESFTNLYTKHYPELINSLTNIEANGFALDVDYLKEVKETFIEKIAHLEEAMMKTDEVKKTVAYKEKLFALGLQEKTKPVKERDAVIYKYYTDLRNGLATQFSPTKKFDLGYALFGVNGYKLPPEKKYIPKSVMTALRNKQITEDDLTYMDYSTGKDSLDMLAKLHPDFELVKLVKEYVRLNKLLTTYTDSLIEKADSNNVVHGRFVSTGTGTTRLSSNNPNMQNISKPSNNPSDIDYEYPIKRAFIPHYKKGQDTIVNLDFSSQEAHLAAVIAHDDDMIGSFLDGADVHKATAALMYNKEIDEVTKDERFAAKSTTFGLFYGMSPMAYKEGKMVTDSKTGEKREMTVQEAEKIFEKYFEGKPKIKEAIDEAQQFVTKNGYIEIPISGFRRKLMDIYSNSYSKKQGALRQSFNTLIQGGSAVISQLSIIGIDKVLRSSNLNASLVGTVHDSITISAAKDDVDEVIKLAKHVMEHLPLDLLNIDYKGKQIYFPMEAEADIGSSYAYEFSYDKEDFDSFMSTKGFTEYYKKMKKIEDMEEAGDIDKDTMKNLMDRFSLQKNKYQMLS